MRLSAKSSLFSGCEATQSRDGADLAGALPANPPGGVPPVWPLLVLLPSYPYSGERRRSPPSHTPSLFSNAHPFFNPILCYHIQGGLRFICFQMLCLGFCGALDHQLILLVLLLFSKPIFHPTFFHKLFTFFKFTFVTFLLIFKSNICVIF